MPIEADELVAVQVPKHLLPRVYGLIAASYNANTSSAEEVSGDQGAGLDGAFVESAELDARWQDGQLLRRCWKESPPSMRAVMKRLREQPGKPVTIIDIAKAVYGDGELKSRQKLAGVLGAFGRRVKNRYAASSWPFLAEYNHLTNLWEYTMTPEIAAKVRSF